MTTPPATGPLPGVAEDLGSPFADVFRPFADRLAAPVTAELLEHLGGTFTPQLPAVLDQALAPLRGWAQNHAAGIAAQLLEDTGLGRIAEDLAAAREWVAELTPHPGAPLARRVPWSLHPGATVDGTPGDPCRCHNTTTPHRSVALPGDRHAWCPYGLDRIARREDRARVRVLLAARRLGLRVYALAAPVWNRWDPEDLAELAAALTAGAPIPEHLAELAALVELAAETAGVAHALAVAEHLDRLTAHQDAPVTARARPPGRTPTRRRVPCRAHLRARSSARSDDPAPTSRRGALVGRPGVSTAGTGARPPT
jgi:hypothetical protein